MAARFLSLHRLRRALPLARPPLFSSSPKPSPPSPIPPLRFLPTPTPLSPSRGHRSFSHGTVDLILSEGKPPRFETHELEPPKKDKWRSKKRLKMQRKRAKRKRRDANKKDPRRIRPKGKKTKHKFPDAEARIKYKIEKARIKEAMLVEKLKRYEVPKVQGPMVKPENLTGEERFYMKKMAQKRSNYVPVGRRGVFGGVILNMHLHWKKHETVKVVCKPCKPGQVHEYARDIARLSGGVPIQIIGNDTIIFYRGKNYVQPEVMSPIDTLSKKKALEKSKYEQSLETVRRFIAISEKELELYYRHIALYGDPSSRNSDLVYGDSSKVACKLETKTSDLMEEKNGISSCDDICSGLSDMEVESGDDELTGTDVDAYDELESEDDSEGEELYESNYSQDKENKSTLPTHQFETFVHHQ